MRFTRPRVRVRAARLLVQKHAERLNIGEEIARVIVPRTIPVSFALMRLAVRTMLTRRGTDIERPDGLLSHVIKLKDIVRVMLLELPKILC